MEKPAETNYPILDLLRHRWSPRAFADRAVEPEKLRRLLEAARWAASCFNAQPWRFIIATQENLLEYERMLPVLAEFNQLWAKQAPVLMLAVAKRHFEHQDSENKHALYDVGQAVATLTVQATELGLVVHQMAGFDAEKAREVFGIPEEYLPVTAIALGYPGDPDTLPEKLKERELAPRVRKPLTEIAFAGKWGQPASLVAAEQ